MAGFLRKKPKQDQRIKQVPASSPPPASSPNATPLFAKFATTKQVQEGPRVVSSPIVLSSQRTHAAAPPHHIHARAAANQAAVQPQRDGNLKRTQENGHEYLGGYSPRTLNGFAAAPQPILSGGTRMEVEQPQGEVRLQARPEHGHAFSAGDPSQPSTWGTAAPAPHQLGQRLGQPTTQPSPFYDTRSQNPMGNAGNISSEQGDRVVIPRQISATAVPIQPMPRNSILDKPLPIPVEPIRSPVNNSRPLSGELSSPIQGEYSHLWSMIVGEDVQLPDILEGLSIVNPDANTSGKILAQESSSATAPNLTPAPDLVAFASDSSKSLANSATLPNAIATPPKPSYPIASQPSLSSEHQVHTQSLLVSQSDRSSSYQGSVADTANSAVNGRTTISTDDDERNSRPYRSYDNAHTNEVPTIPEQSFDTPPLSTSPNTHRKLSKSTKPNGQPRATTRSPSVAQKAGNVARPGSSSSSQPSQEDPRKSFYNSTGAMGANISAPDTSGIQHHRTLHKEPTMMAHNQHVVPSPPPTTHAFAQRMSMQYPASQYPASPHNNTSPPRKSASMRSTTGKVPGKPLIFSAMTAVDHNGASMNNPDMPSPPVVQYRNWPNGDIPSQHPQQQQSPQPPPQPAAMIPPRRDSIIRPYAQPLPQPPPPMQSQQGRRISPPTTPNRASQVGSSPIRHPSSASRSISTAPVPIPPPKTPHMNGTHAELPPSQLHQSPSRSRKSSIARPPQPSVESRSGVAAMNGEAYPRTPVKMRPTPSMSPSKAGPIQIDGDVLGVPLDDDPFAKVEGVKMLAPTLSRPPSPTGTSLEPTSRRLKSRDGKKEGGDELYSDSGSFEPSRPASRAQLPLALTPRSSDERISGREAKVFPKEDQVMVSPPEISGEEGGQDYLTGFLGDEQLFGTLLGLLTFYDWCMILSLSRDIRFMLVQNPALRETVLERFLKMDLNDYMRGVSTPTHEYARIAALYNHSLFVHPSHRDQSLYDTVHGDWLSDKSVLDCEAELRRAGVMGLLRLGDVVWDVAVGDEGNVGRLIWDGSYLIDLDYTYSPIGDLPKYMPTLAFPPSYFHRVIRTGPNSSNPTAHIDLRPWGEEIAANLQLLQDRVRTETPQGAYHNVVRWVHRSSFVIRPPGRGAMRQNHPPVAHAGPPRVPIPETNLFVDPGWYGTIVVETEGTNESLADLQARCGPGAFPPRPAPVNGFKATDRDNKLVFRILREKSRPGEIWIRAVSPKERLL
ncbi:hypothetical protein H0H92_014523 [Tricholoma furcatifolium]|nr:hypothetical protein H0H92_014523 [Tricholoma furcatifolium]